MDLESQDPIFNAYLGQYENLIWTKKLRCSHSINSLTFGILVRMISCLCSRGINPSKGVILRVIQCNFPPTSKQPHRNLGWLFGPTLPKHHPQYKRQRRNYSILTWLMAGAAFIYTYLCYLEDMPRAVRVFDPDRSGHLFR